MHPLNSEADPRPPASAALRVSSLVAYALTCVPALAGWAAGHEAGQALAVGTGGILSWPYPILLPLRPLLASLGPLEIPAAEAAGLVGVWGLARVLEHRLGPAARHPVAGAAIGAVAWPFFLAVVNGFIHMTGIGWAGALGE